ncbi:MAG TPA: fibronectin type III domain-containing protein, partial [Cyclobacteriaceae bacterium]|nr:fibronectin type III domain-containing protein [Cyclobacteriaceae bacterium]
QLIYGSDIADYFKMSNLVFQGLNPNEVQKSGGRLPEGIYRISFEVLDYNRNTVVSNRGSATAWMILNDPPFINLPVNNAKIKPLNPQNIVFQWTPRHRGSPNAAFTTNYDVKLVEIWPAGRNPFDAINTSRPIYETTTSATMVVYGPAETPLVLGREYALQVRARDNGGRDVFKNNGYSEVVRFIYGDECPMPSGLNADDINISKARLRWQGSGQNSDYLLRYREKKEGARWFEEKTNQSYYNATGLRAGTTYEYQLAGACDIYESEETQIETFTTLTENPNEFVCADPNSVPPPDGSPPLPALFTNDFIYAGGFDVVVNKATGSNGRFSGEGLAVVPWFNSAKVRVTFENIGVNTSYQLTAGEIKSVWDPNSKSLIHDKTQDLADDQKNEDGKDNLTASLITFEGTINSVYVNPEGKIVVIDSGGNETVYDQPVIGSTEEKQPVEITDSDGNSWGVDKEGKVSEGGFGIGKSGSNGIDSRIIMQRELITELLESIKREIILWLENNGKGPLDEALIRRLMAMPDCLPEDEGQLESVLERIDYYENNREELIALIEENESIKDRFRFLINKLNGEQPPYIEGLSEDEWNELIRMICPYLIPESDIEGLNKNLELVTFNSFPDDYKLKNGRLVFTYTLAATLPLNYNKLEIFKLEDQDTISVSIYTDLVKGQAVSFIDSHDQDSIGWSGKDTNGEYVDAGNYIVSLTAAVDSEFINGFRELRELKILPYDMSIADDVDFEGFDSTDPAGCFRRASDMLKNAGYQAVAANHEDVVQMTIADENGDLVIQDDILDGIQLINDHLNRNIPIMVGVDYHDGHPGNSDQTTDHWLVIVGRTTTNNQTCYRYYDAQTGIESIGTSTDNELCEQDDHSLKDTYREGSVYERTYTVTMVRPSEKINE